VREPLKEKLVAAALAWEKAITSVGAEGSFSAVREREDELFAATVNFRSARERKTRIKKSRKKKKAARK
jgi:hypothetical protein